MKSLITNNEHLAETLACRTLCLNTANCQSLTFGLVDGSLTCSLFSIAASELAPISELLAFDINCPTTSLDIGASVSTGGIDTNADLAASIDSGIDVGGNSDADTGLALKAKKRDEPVVVAADVASVVIANVALEVPSLKNCALACQNLELCEGFELVGSVCQLLGGTGA
jgi:hypothetical protein